MAHVTYEIGEFVGGLNKPQTLEELEPYLDELNFQLQEEFNKISAVIREFISTGHLVPELNAEPERPHNGMIVIADGTDWNPGAGAGFYIRKLGVWTLIV